MKVFALYRLCWMLAVALLLGHDFIPHRHIHHSHSQSGHHHDHEDHESQEQDFDVTGMFNHTHGAGQTTVTWYLSKEEVSSDTVDFKDAILHNTKYFVIYEAINEQVRWPGVGGPNAPPLPPGWKQLRAPPFSSSITLG